MARGRGTRWNSRSRRFEWCAEAKSVEAVSQVPGMVAQTLHNWVKAEARGLLKGTAARPVSPEQMEISRLRAELARVKMERDILKKATAYFAKESE